MKKAIFITFVATGVTIFANARASSSNRKNSCPGMLPKQLLMAPVKVETETFSWTNNPAVLKNPTQFVTAKIDRAHSANCEAGVGRQGGDLEDGNGFYTAGDPFNSMEYGKYLIVVPVKAGTSDIINVKNLENPKDFDQAILSNASAVFYDFGGFDFVGGDAIVFRNKDVLNLNKIRIINTDLASTPLSRHATLQTESNKPLYESLLTQFGDHRSLIAAIAANLDHFQDDLGDDAKKKNMNFLALQAALSDVRLSQGPAQSIFANIRTPKLKNLLPKCAEAFESFGNPEEFSLEERAKSLCLDNYFSALHSAMGHMNEDGFQFDSGGPDEDLTVSEVNQFLVLTNLIPVKLKADSFLNLAIALSEQVQKSGALERVQNLIGPIGKVKNHFKQTSFTSWDE